MDETQRNAAESLRALSAIKMETQTQLASVLGVSQRSVSRKLIGQAPWTLSEVAVLAEHYGVSVAQIMAGPRAWLGQADGTLPSSEVTPTYPYMPEFSQVAA